MNQDIIKIPIQTKDDNPAYIQGIFTKSGKFVVVNEKVIIGYMMGVLLFLLIVLLLIYSQISTQHEALGELIVWVNQNQTMLSPP